MKITKSQLKQIIKEELEIFEAEMVVRGGNLSPASWRRQAATTAGMEFPPSDEYKPQEVPVTSEERYGEYESIPVMTMEEWKELNLNMYEPGGYWDNKAKRDPIVMLMLETVGRMASVYEEFPPAVGKMATLVTDQDWSAIHNLFNIMWMELIKYHRDSGTRLQPRVSHNFRTIDTIVRNL